MALLTIIRSPEIAWGLLWIVFQLAILVGFILLGVTVFKRTPEAMKAQAGELLVSLLSDNI